MKTALAQMGSSVFSGALTTFLGVLALVFGSVEISRIFAKLICMLIALSAFYGLVLSPIFLHYIGKKWNSISTTGCADSTPVDADGDKAERSDSVSVSVCPDFSSIADAKKQSISLQQLPIISDIMPPVSVSETPLSDSKLSASMTVLPQPSVTLKKSSKSRSHSMQILSKSSSKKDVSADVPRLYLPSRVCSDGEAFDPFAKPLPLSSSIRWESSL